MRNSFFNRPPHEVAKELEGKTLTVNGKTCEILHVIPRSRKDNSRWLNSKPLFGKDPVDVYVSRFRGACLLFIRTKPDTCVRIEVIAIHNEIICGPGRVCKALGITKTQTGSYRFTKKNLEIQFDVK